MTFSISLTELLRGVYADASLICAGSPERRPAVLRSENDRALRRIAVSAFSGIIADIIPWVSLGSFTTSSPGEIEPEMLSVEFNAPGIGDSRAPQVRSLLETALEREILSVAYANPFPDVARANSELSRRAVAAIIALADSSAPASRIRPWE